MKKKYNIKILPDMNNGDYFIKSLENDNVAIVKFKSGYKVFSLDMLTWVEILLCEKFKKSWWAKK